MKPDVAERREFPVEDAEVMPVGELKKKRRRDRKLAAERSRQMNERAQCQDWCRRRGLPIAHRGTSHHVKVTWQTKETGKKMSGHPRIAWHKRSVGRRNCIRSKYEERIQRLRERVWILHKGGTGIKNIGGRRLLCQKKTVPTKNAIGVCRSGQRSPLGWRRTRKKTFYDIVSMKIVKRIVGSSVSL
jgi:hypothetical protein